MAEDRKIIIIIIGRYRDILYQRQNFEQFLFIACNRYRHYRKEKQLSIRIKYVLSRILWFSLLYATF